MVKGDRPAVDRAIYSGRKMAVDREMLAFLKAWRTATHFAAEGDWMFASPVKLGGDNLGAMTRLNAISCGQPKQRALASWVHTSMRHTYRFMA